MKKRYTKYYQQVRLLLAKGQYFATRTIMRYLAWEYSWKTTSVGLLVLFAGGLLVTNILHSSALSVTLVPNADFTTGWASPSTAGSHYVLVDDSATDNTSDYVGTGTAGSGGEVEEYDMATQTGIASASQIQLRVWAESATNANGGTLDTISINIRINGTLQTATTCTPAFGVWGACNATFNGSWTQSDIDSLRVQITRNKQGSGSPSNQDDDVRIANVYTTLTYVPTLTVSQSAYRWFNNQDTNSPVTFAFAAETGTASGAENGRSNVVTSDGGSVMVGSGPCAGTVCAITARYGPTGNLMWNVTWGGASGFTTPTSVVENTDGTIVVAGSTGAFGGSKVFLLKYTSSGTLLWSSLWSGSSEIVNGARALIRTSDGGYAVTGETTFFADSSAGDAFVVKFTSSGGIDWARTWGFAGGQEQGYGLAETTDGGIVMIGTSTYFAGEGDNAFAVKYSGMGTRVWANMVRGTGSDDYYGITPTTDGGFVAVGGTGTYDVSGFSDVLITKYDSNGAVTWAKTWGGASLRDEFNSVIVASDGSYVAAGLSYSYGGGSSDAVLAKFATDGTLTWAKTFGGTGTETAYYASQTSDGGYLLTGTTASYGAGNNDFLTLKYDGSGTITGCSSPMCQSPGGTATDRTSALTPTVWNAQTAAESSPTAGATNPTGDVGSQTYVRTMTVASTPQIIDVSSTNLTAAQDTAATAPAEGTPFRLRLNLHMSGSTVAANAGQYKLKFAPKGAALNCSAVLSSAYTDVTDSSTIQYYDNPNAVSALGLASNANDPVHSGDAGVARQSYQERGTSTFTNPNSIPASQDGMWDFALVAYHSLQNDRYCFKVYNSDDTALNSYSQIPELIIPPATFSQAAYRWYNPEPSGTNSTFAKSYGDSSSQGVAKTILTSDGGYATIGNSGPVASSTGLVTKYTAGGTISWTQSISIQDTGVSLADLVETYDGGIVVVGSTIDYFSDEDMFTAALDIDGNLNWEMTWGGGASDYASAVCVDSSNNIIVVGDTYSFGTNGSKDAAIVMYDQYGAFFDSTTFGSSLDDSGLGVASTSNGGFVVTGNATMSGSQSSIYIATYDSSLTLLSSQLLDGTYNEQPSAIKQTSDGGFIISGQTNSYSGGGNNDALLTKLGSSGSLSWTRVWGGTGIDSFSDVIQTSDGGFAATGYTNSYGNGTYNVVLAKYSSAGVLSWDRTWGGTATQYGGSLKETADGGFIVAGNTTSYAVGSDDTLLLKYDSSASINGCTIPVCSDPTVSVDQPSGLTLTPVTPNPPTTSAGDMGSYFSASISTSYITLTTTLIYGQPVPVGNPLAPLNSPLDLSTLSPLHLRMAIAMNDSGVATNGVSFKLQYAIKSGQTSCSTVPTGNYGDVTSFSTIAYFDDNGYDSGGQIDQNINDPSDGVRPMKAQTYQEANNFTNSVSNIYAGEDGIWQFSLVINNSTLKGKDFCLRAYSVTNSSMLSAANVADIAYAPQMTQMLRGGKWFNRQGKLQPFSL